MKHPRVLTVQDISCVGRCSLTVALPVISACGVETSVLPTAVLSTHTGIKGPTFRDLTEDMPAIADHWVQAGVKFDCILTGYLGSVRQMEYVRQIMEKTAAEGCIKIVDPAMADHGKLYAGFDSQFVEAMKHFCAGADYVLPNLTEICLLTDTPYREDYDLAYIEMLLHKMQDMGCENIAFTGVSFDPRQTGVLVLEKGDLEYYAHEKLPRSYHGTGDLYAAAFTGALAKGKTAFEAAVIAADFCTACIRNSDPGEAEWYGVRFEPVLGMLMKELGGL